MRSKLILVTTPATAVGFRLAGVDVAEVTTNQEAEEAVERIILGSDYGMAAVEEDFVKTFSERTKRLIKDAELPMVVPFPGKESNVWKVEDRIDYVANLIRSAIGYHIKLSR